MHISKVIQTHSNLFVFRMEKFACLIQELVDSKKWHPIKIAKDAHPSPIFFCRCLLFSSANSSWVHVVKKAFDLFCKASGLKINLQKYRFIVSKNISRRKTPKFSNILGFQHTQDIGKIRVFL